MRNYFFILLLMMLFSCGKKDRELPENTLLTYEDKVLTLEDIEEKIPRGLNPYDSVAMFNNLIEAWIRDCVLVKFAEERLYDLDAIDRLVEDYRNSLIVQEYVSRYLESQPQKIDEQRIREYYDSHRKDMKLEVPLIRGIFIKVNSTTNGKEQIKNLLKSDRIEDIDKLENEWLDKALEYNYFRDKWIDWNTLEEMIPFRFGDPEEFLSHNKFFETTYGDCTYYLQIGDYLPSGSEQPYEFARGWILNVMTRGDLAEYEKVLVNSLVDKAVKNKRLKGVGYDLTKHELKKNHVIQRNEE